MVVESTAKSPFKSMAHSILCSFPIRRPLRLSVQNTSLSQTLRRSSSEILRFQDVPESLGCLRTSSVTERLRFSAGKLKFCVRVENRGGVEVQEKTVVDENADEHEDEDEDEDEVEEDREFRAGRIMPDRFKLNLVQQELFTLPRWPFFVGAALFVYAWRMVLWELGNWKNTLFSVTGFIGAVIDYYLGAPISATLETIGSFFASIVYNGSVPKLTTIVMLASSVLAISESAAPGSSTCQPYILTVSGLVGYAADKGFIPKPVFWLILIGIFGYARFIKKRDYVSSSLPVATVLASVGEPWVRALAIISFTGVAISHHWSNMTEGKEKEEEEEEEDVEGSESSWRRVPQPLPLPLPLTGIALAIGMRLAAQWAMCRHLTWKIA